MLGELPISAKHVQRITERLGEERRQQRDAQVSAMKAGTLKPMYPQPPRSASVAPERPHWLRATIAGLTARSPRVDRWTNHGGSCTLHDAKISHMVLR